jgi:hypothetical protein
LELEAARLAEEAYRQGELAEEQAQRARDLEREAAEQKQRFEALKREYDRLFASQVKQAVAPGGHITSDLTTTIYLHISDEGQRPRAKDIAQQLALNDIVVPGIQRVPVSVRSTQVRYFREADREGAQKIKGFLSAYLGVRRVEHLLIPGFEDKVRSRQYEIWFARDAFAAAPATRESEQR